MLFFSISAFRTSLNNLLNARRGEYSSVSHDIANSLISKNINEITNSPEMVLQDSGFKIVKLRIQDSKHKLGKSNGFRLIYYASTNFNIICFLDIYPKNGSLHKNTLSSSDIKELLKGFIADQENRTLICHNIADMIKEQNKETCNINNCEKEQKQCSV